jgi:probable phosphoglycerate mutase
MPMATNVYVLRHGRTALNAAGLLRGRLDEPLDGIGRAEAAALAKLFAAVALREIVSSPLSRARDTALAVAAARGMEVKIVREFIDRDYGPWSGKPRELVERRYGSVDGAPADEIEEEDAFRNRLTMALETAVAHVRGGSLLIVAHDAVNRALIRHCCPALSDIPQPTGCWNLLVFGEGATECKVIGAVPGDGRTP